MFWWEVAIGIVIGVLLGVQTLVHLEVSSAVSLLEAIARNKPLPLETRDLGLGALNGVKRDEPRREVLGPRATPGPPQRTQGLDPRIAHEVRGD